MAKQKPAPTAAPVLSFDKRLASLTDADAALTTSLTGFEARFEKLHDGCSFPQAAMDAKLLLDRMAKRIEEATEAFKKAAVEHFKAGGEFEHGKIAIQVSEQSRTTPKWQDVAMSLAQAAALARGEAFDKNAYLEAEKAKVVPNIISLVKLTVSA